MSKAKLWESFTNNSLHKVQEVVDFLEEEYPPSNLDIMWSYDYFNWKLGDLNPAGRGFLAYALHEGKVVGSATLTKKRVLLDGIEYLASEVGDTYTSSGFRRKCKPKTMSQTDANPNSYVNRSIFGRLITELVNKSEESGVSIIYGTPNKNSCPGYTKRLSFINYEQYGNMSYYRPTAHFLLRKFPVLGPLGFIIKRLELLMIWIQNLLFTRVINRKVTVSVSMPTVDEFDKLWLRIKPELGFSLVRDSLYWKHRYSDRPHIKYQFIKFHRNGELVAVAVTRKIVNNSDNVSVAIVEWMNEDGFKFGHILAVVMNLYKTSKVSYFYTWLQSSSKNSRIAMKNLFLIRKKQPIIFSGNTISKNLIDSEKELNIFLGSSDAV